MPKCYIVNRSQTYAYMLYIQFATSQFYYLLSESEFCSFNSTISGSSFPFLSILFYPFQFHSILFNQGVPEWKRKLMEKKQKEEDEKNPQSQGRTEDEEEEMEKKRLEAMPEWKRQIYLKKKQEGTN